LRMQPSPWVSLRIVNPILIVVLGQSRRHAMACATKRGDGMRENLHRLYQ
jgi:hypothetical protein